MFWFSIKSIMTDLQPFPTYNCKLFFVNLLSLYECVRKIERKLNCIKMRMGMILLNWLMLVCYSSCIIRCNVRDRCLILGKWFGTKLKKKFESRRSFNDAKLAYGLIIILVKIVDVILKSSWSLKTWGHIGYRQSPYELFWYGG